MHETTLVDKRFTTVESTQFLKVFWNKKSSTKINFEELFIELIFNTCFITLVVVALHNEPFLHFCIDFEHRYLQLSYQDINQQ
jgi:hypothetical protein